MGEREAYREERPTYKGRTGRHIGRFNPGIPLRVYKEV